MIPGEYRLMFVEIDCNVGRETKSLRVANFGDRPIQIGSHYHFAEINRQLSFHREQTIGMRLNIAAGTAVRFEPGEEKEVELTTLGGEQQVFGLNDQTNGSVTQVDDILESIKKSGFEGGTEA